MAQHDWPSTEPTEVVLPPGDARLAVDLRGGGMRRLVVGDWDVLDGYPAGAVIEGWPGAVLVPWPNRVRDGRWTWHGRASCSSTCAPRGAARDARPRRLAAVVGARPRAGGATVGHGRRAAPRLSLPARRRRRLRAAPDRLTVTVRVRNVGAAARRSASGMHPYLHVGAPRGRRHRRRRAERPGPDGAGDRGRPAHRRRTGSTGTSAGSAPRVRHPAHRPRARRRRLGPAAAARPGGELELAVDGAWPWLQIFTGDGMPEGQRRRSLAVEPMTCPPNALADGVDLLVLEPGAEWSGTWTLAWTAA